VYRNLNKASQDIWLKNRFSSDQSKLDAFLAFPNDPARVTEQIEKARTRLHTIEDLLAYQQSQGSGWLAGDKPSHADALVFGFYVFQILNPQVKKELWEHESLPLVQAWVERVKGLLPADALE
jgi:glutathione S-transferase